MDDVMLCAARLAFLEGVHRLALPDTHAFTPQSVERRVSAIERHDGRITLPPPNEPCTWNSLMWRLWRADFRADLVTNPLFDAYLDGLAGMLKENCTTAVLRRVVDSLGHDLPEIKCPREQAAAAAGATEAGATEGEECEECLVAVVQKLAYVGGRLGQRPPIKPFSKGTIQAFAAVVGENFGLFGSAPRHQPDAPIRPASPNAERAGPGYGPTGWTSSGEGISSLYNPPSTASNERRRRRTSFHQGDSRPRAAFGQDMDNGRAFNQNDPRGTALNQNGNRQDALNQHNPRAGAFNFNFPPTTTVDHDSRPGLAVDTDIPRDTGLGSNVHGRVAFDPDSPHRPGFAPPASRAPTPSRPASAGSDNGGPSVPAAAAQPPRSRAWRRGMGFLRSKERGQRQRNE
ncbi:hypothetical protein BB8028_0001g05610 [Beauveria bassiana]|uniref:Uncharacterized protein n=1 Tax=Beauveria bassiana TaxID=176275 RepID=A0A2S7XX49_BEABA|nr:hypothetical protein BB8028_0001g05610 [Beauveria bassiana]